MKKLSISLLLLASTLTFPTTTLGCGCTNKTFQNKKIKVIDGIPNKYVMSMVSDSNNNIYIGNLNCKIKWDSDK